ncbi:uncharacterized protein LOC118738850 [Rhagoletis pomonella]|uniref:uncharacterized protein LOC118738850 n=1 Tax=Rhagoletis pomonella TaxID=28610 RepID=UPI00177AEDF7|nr:uncharacterized protein LOC118738850 [Rhagoletis pomonella]
MSANQTEATFPPTYLNGNYIKRALESHFNGANVSSNKCKVQILECHWKRATEDCENFCSVIYRANVHFHLHCAGAQNSNEKRELTVIVKDVNSDVAEEGSNEWAMYEHVLPEMQSILEKAAKKNQNGDAAIRPKLYANCLFCEHNEKEIYVLEDLNLTEYQSANRFIGMDLEEAKITLKKLAQFHAVSMKYIENFPTESAALRPSTFDCEMDIENDGLDGIRASYNIVTEWIDFEDIAAKMHISVKKFDECAKRIMRPERCNFKVITHGDLWSNNILIKYATVEGMQVPHDAVFVDFQVGFVGSCGYDLNFFLNTSTQLNVLKLHRFELLRFYYTHLKETLKHLGTEAAAIPSWQMVLEEVRDLEFVGYYALTCELPTCCMNRGISPDSPKIYESKRFLEMLRYGVDRLNELGVLDL